MGKKIFFVILLTVIVFFVLIGLKNIIQNSPTNYDNSGDYDFSFSHDGITRTYKVHIPLTYNNNSPSSLVVVLHGGGGNSQDIKDVSLMDSTSDKYGFIAAYPQGSGTKYLGRVWGVWNSGCCSPDYIDDSIDDVGFISKMIDEISENYNVDSDTVYATGHSMGAQMSYGLACELSDKIAAIAPVGGIPPEGKFLDCETNVSIMHIHGTEDACVLYGGGICGGCFDELTGKDPSEHQWPCDSVNDFIESVAKKRGIVDSVTSFQELGYTCLNYGPDQEIVLCTVESMGHSWPGGTLGSSCENPDSNKCELIKSVLGEINTDVSANEIMWKFFEN
jgi:polyhydroxybutyrate depolymerase